MENNDKKITTPNSKNNDSFENLSIDELSNKIDVVSQIAKENAEKKSAKNEQDQKIIFSSDGKNLSTKKNEKQVFIINNEKDVEGVEDINSNLGKFANKIDHATIQEAKEEVKTTILKDINFDKFKNQNKKVKVQKKSIFGEKVSGYLRTKKSLGIIWGIELLIIVIIFAISLVLILSVQPYLSRIGIDGPWNWEINRNCANVGYIFDIIACCVLILPFLFLLTSTFIGINGVFSSKAFHYSMWIIIIISLVFFVIGSLLCAIPLIEQALFLN